MYYLFFALFMAFASPSHHTKNHCHTSTVTTQGDTGNGDDPDDGDGSGGDGEHVPPDHP
jgi:hypothetical protein